jgi:hypothetical protein
MSSSEAAQADHPYLTGVTPACQVKPDITPEQFGRALATGDAYTSTSPSQIRRPLARCCPGGRGIGARHRNLLARPHSTKFARAAPPARASLRPYEQANTGMLTLDHRRTIGDGKKHRLGRIVNPARLLRSL